VSLPPASPKFLHGSAPSSHEIGCKLSAPLPHVEPIHDSPRAPWLSDAPTCSCCWFSAGIRQSMVDLHPNLSCHLNIIIDIIAQKKDETWSITASVGFYCSIFLEVTIRIYKGNEVGDPHPESTSGLARSLEVPLTIRPMSFCFACGELNDVESSWKESSILDSLHVS
jgi:hypothetical protein